MLVVIPLQPVVQNQSLQQKCLARLLLIDDLVFGHFLNFVP